MERVSEDSPCFPAGKRQDWAKIRSAGYVGFFGRPTLADDPAQVAVHLIPLLSTTYRFLLLHSQSLSLPDHLLH
jgi:hypothetical protein